MQAVKVDSCKLLLVELRVWQQLVYMPEDNWEFTVTKIFSCARSDQVVILS